jgi:3'-phosphoadenosine 5'-phosphosulfate sulfotransferase (PAPS reductase)/FAD synthetase
MKKPSSKPLSFWTENDVLQYIKQNSIEIAKPYGDVVYADNDEQYSFLDRSEDKLKTTGMSRTGCIFCGFGCHLEKQSRWLLLRESHPKLYNYCIGGGEYVNGVWQPSKSGLGMGHVFDQLNAVYGENFIKYK